MARVHMLMHITGGRGDGYPWPAAGGLLECDEQEARDLVAGGMAAWAGTGTVVAPPPVAELAVAVPEPVPAGDESPEAENGSESDGKPRVRDPKEAWEMHAVTLGATPELVAAMSKKDLIDQYGK